MPAIQVIIDDSTDKTIAGVHVYDRVNGGTFIGSSGSSFPVSPAAKEWFWRSDEDKLYRRNNGNTAWDTVVASVGAHAATHQNGGADEVSVAGLSGELADDQPPKTHALGTAHSTDTLANLNAKVTDATLIDTGDSRLSDDRDPNAHAASHQNVGADEISVAGLSGELADDQPPKTHALGTAHSTDTLANLNAKVTDATLDDSGDPRTDDDAIHDDVTGEINAISAKSSLVSNDIFLIEDSAASYAKKKVTVANLPGGVDTTAIHKATSAEISAITEKGTPIAADLLLIEDSAASNAKKRVQIGNLPGGGGDTDLKAAQFVDSTGNQAITGTALTVNIDSNPVSDVNYSLASDEITINSDGRYEIIWTIVYDITNTTGATRASVEGWIEDDIGGYAATPGSYGRCYHREASGGSGLNGQCVVDLSDGDKIRLRAIQLVYTTNIDTAASRSALTIKKVGP